jgi:biotin transport system substrate-specific component
MSKFTARDITLTAVFTALIVIAAMLLRYAGPIIPFSLLPFVAMLAGGILGPRLGALSFVVYILIGLIGVPVFATPPFGGPGYILKPSFGFLIGFACAAYVIGHILSKPENQSLIRYVMAMMAGIVVTYVIGLPYIYVILNFVLDSSTSVLGVLALGFFPFIILDLIKGVVAAYLARAVSRRLHGIGGNPGP